MSGHPSSVVSKKNNNNWETFLKYAENFAKRLTLISLQNNFLFLRLSESKEKSEIM